MSEQGLTFDDLPALLTMEDLATVLRCGRNTAYELTRRPDFPVMRLGRRLLVPKTALEKWLGEQTPKPALGPMENGACQNRQPPVGGRQR